MKTTNVKILCDSCSADISPEVTSYPHKFILRVSVQDVAQRNAMGAIYAIHMLPPIKDDLYFCGIQCMKNYDPNKQKD